jgi:hypothetical protein
MSQQAQLAVQTQPGHPQGMPLHGSIFQRAAINTTITPVPSGILQRCSGGVECEERRQRRLERQGMMQRAAVSAAPVNSVPPIVHDVLSSSGQPLDAGTRAFMEPRFGHDFSQVRVHMDDRAVESAQAVNALAYTVGRDVVFGTGQYAPGTSDGRRLLAHELTHVVQQSGQSTSLNARVVFKAGNDPLEQEAEHLADTFAYSSGFSTVTSHTSNTLMQRADAGGSDDTYNACMKQAQDDNDRCTDSGATYCTLIQGGAGLAGGTLGAGLGTLIAPGLGTGIGAVLGGAAGLWLTKDCGAQVAQKCRNKLASSQERCKALK